MDYGHDDETFPTQLGTNIHANEQI
jgi:hypothetical protein